MAKRKRAKTPQASGVTIPTKCRECGSTKRSRYTNSIVLGSGILLRDDLPGIPAGTAYESLTKSRCICLKCGQARVDQRFEFDPEVLYALRTNKQEETTEQA